MFLNLVRGTHHNTSGSLSVCFGSLGSLCASIMGHFGAPSAYWHKHPPKSFFPIAQADSNPSHTAQREKEILLTSPKGHKRVKDE